MRATRTIEEIQKASRRAKRMTFRLSETEASRLRGKCTVANVSESEFIRQLINTSEPVSFDALEAIKWELKKVGVNVNQLAYRANSRGISADILTAMAGELAEIEKIAEALRGIKWQ